MAQVVRLIIVEMRLGQPGYEVWLLAFASGGIRVFCQIAQCLEERGWLADEESHFCEEIDYVHGNPQGFSGTDDGAGRELAAEEWARLGHDQVGLEG